jgi:hypothetical protein
VAAVDAATAVAVDATRPELHWRCYCIEEVSAPFWHQRLIMDTCRRSNENVVEKLVQYVGG